MSKKSILLRLCVKKNVSQGLSKSSEVVVKMQKGRSLKSQINAGYGIQHEGLASLAHRTEKCIDFGL